MAIIDKKVNLALVGIDGNIFAVMGAFSRQARKEKWTKEEIDKVLEAVMTCGDYNKALVIIMDHCKDPAGADEDDN